MHSFSHTLSLGYYTHTHTHTHMYTLYPSRKKQAFSVCVCVTLKPLSHQNPCHTNTNLFADCWATRKKTSKMLIRLARLAFAMHSPRIPESALNLATGDKNEHVSFLLCYLQDSKESRRRWRAFALHSAGIRQHSAFALHLAHIRSHWSAVADPPPPKKKVCFLPSLLFFFLS